MPVNEENPLLLVSIYAQTKNTEWMTDPTGQTVPKGVPAQGNLTVTGVWDMIPDDLKPHTAIQLHGDDFVGHGYGGKGDHDALWAWYGYFVDQAEEYNRNEPDTSKHINLYLTLMTGGTPISVLNRTVPDDELTQFIAEHDCIMVCSRNKRSEHFRTTLYVFYHPTASQSIFHAVCIIFSSSKSKREYENFGHSTVIWESGCFIIRP